MACLVETVKSALESIPDYNFVMPRASEPTNKVTYPTFHLRMNFNGARDGKYLIFDAPIDQFFIEHQKADYVQRHKGKDGYYRLRTTVRIADKCYFTLEYREYDLTLILFEGELILRRFTAVPIAPAKVISEEGSETASESPMLKTKST